MTSDRGHRAPPPLPEAERRAWLEAMGIPLWLPQGESGSAAESAALETDLAPSAVGEPAAAPGESQPVARMDWAQLRETVLACRACPLCEARTQAVFGVGQPDADLLVLGEAPGQEEDRRGEPFVGRAGQLLDRMLAAIGLDRDTVYITNVLKCRPPRNRDPQAAEAEACAPYLARQIELMQPKVILAVGRIAAQQLLGSDEPLGVLRGRWHSFEPGGIPVRVSYHPAFLLRQPAAKAKAWADLKQLRAPLRATASAE